MHLKKYQARTLERLGEFFRLARMESGIAAAYRAVAHRTRPDDDGKKVAENPYASAQYEERISGLSDCPHVCIRIPTGGGKTLLAAHSAPMAVPHWEWLADKDGESPWWRPPVLWLVPSTRIREQTADALRNPRHPCRTALGDGFESGVEIYDIGDCCDIPSAAYGDATCVIVTTIQAIHIEETHGAGTDERARRRVYLHHENLEPHFDRTPADLIRAAGLESAPESLGGGPAYSFANWMRLTRPIVILDEAHNATTEKWKKTFPRFRPSCILEFTATPRPEKGSRTAKGFCHNVLTSASASELEAEEMIKLPVRLTEHPEGWEQAVSRAAAEVRRLGEVAAAHDSEVRPIGLYQATAKNGNAPVEAVKGRLLEDGVPDKEIAVATGEIRELEDVDLLDAQCPVRHVVTVQALREGWDCPFAYVLCSASGVQSATAIEQILGRVLRMPFAERRSHPDLNCAYAHVPETNFAEAAKRLREKMVSLGFEEEEAERVLQPNLPEPGFDSGGDFFGGTTIPATNKPDFGALDETLRKMAESAVEVKKRKGGGVNVIVKAPVPEPVREAILSAVPLEERERQKFALNRACVRLAMKTSPAQRGEVFPPLPQLQFYYAEEKRHLEANPEEFYYAADWNNFPPDCVLNPEKVGIRQEGRDYLLSVEGGRVKWRFAGMSEALEIPEKERAATKERLIGRLERELRDPRYDPDALREFIRRNLDALMKSGGFDLAKLSACRRQLAEEMKPLLRDHEERRIRESWNNGLFGSRMPKLSEIEFIPPEPSNYSCDPETAYRGSFVFEKHYYGAIADLKIKGEEFDCAMALDGDQRVKFWIRNPDSKPHSFRLPLAKTWFYPDFVAVLQNGKVLAVEYKGKHLRTDAKAARRVGKLWEKASKGQAFFIMPTKKKTDKPVDRQLDDKITEIMKAA